MKEGSNEAYSRLLKSELFGSDFASPSLSLSSPAGAAPPSPLSPSKNMLRFKTDHSVAPSSPYSPSILGQQNAFPSDSSTPPPKPPRKVLKTPHKASKIVFLKRKLLASIPQSESLCTLENIRLKKSTFFFVKDFSTSEISHASTFKKLE